MGEAGKKSIASILYSNGVSFAGVLAFIFSVLVVFPVIRVNAKYYGWKVALYIVGVFFSALVATAIVMHYGFALFGILPESAASANPQSTERFAIDYTFWLNLVFLVATGVLGWLRFGSNGRANQQHQHHGEHHHGGGKQGITEQLLFWLAIFSYIWLAGGIIVTLFVSSSG